MKHTSYTRSKFLKQDESIKLHRESSNINQYFRNQSKNNDGENVLITSSGHIISNVSLQDIVKYEDIEYVFLKINQFGIKYVYSLMTIDKFLNVYKEHEEKDETEDGLTRFSNHDNVMKTLFVQRGGKDMPPILNQSVYLSYININQMIFHLITLACMYKLIEGTNNMYAKNLIDEQVKLGVGPYNSKLDIYQYETNSDMSEEEYEKESEKRRADYCKYVLENEENFEAYFPITETKFHSKDYKYLFWNKMGDKIYPSNQVSMTNYIGVFVYLPEYGLWQYLSKKKFERLSGVQNVIMRYALTDHAHCISQVTYGQEFSADNLVDIIENAIFLAMDIYLDRTNPINQRTYRDIGYTFNTRFYEAIELEIEHCDLTTKVILTQQELGISDKNSLGYYKNSQNMGELPKSELRYFSHAEVWLLGLINKVAKLRPTD